MEKWRCGTKSKNPACHRRFAGNTRRLRACLCNSKNLPTLARMKSLVAHGLAHYLPPFVPYTAVSGVLRLRYTPLRMTAQKPSRKLPVATNTRLEFLVPSQASTYINVWILVRKLRMQGGQHFGGRLRKFGFGDPLHLREFAVREGNKIRIARCFRRRFKFTKHSVINKCRL